MKQEKQSIIKTVLVIMCIIITTLLASVSASAAADPTLSSTKETVNVCTNHWYGTSVISEQKGKIVSVKSSKPSVVKVEDREDNFYNWSALKKGKAVITVKYKIGSKTYTLKQTVTVKKVKPFSYIKYNGKNIYKGHEFESYFVKLKSGKKITWKLKKGYKLVSATTNYGMKGYKKLKKNARLTIKKNLNRWINFNVKDSKGNVFEYRIIATK